LYASLSSQTVITKKMTFNLQAVVDEWASSLFRVYIDLSL
jgi:hypothetical protein